MSIPEFARAGGLSDRTRKVTDAFFENLQCSTATQAFNDDPAYGINNPRKLLITSDVGHFIIGTGEQIINDIAPALYSANREIIIVTCFWAKSASQQRLTDSLRVLAARARGEKRLVHVRICFSSCSLWQKLAHTSSLDGEAYPPITWPGTFGLPSLEELTEHGVTGAIGVSLTVKSVFIKPFSVIHPKFIIVDRKQVFLPSCNISWENWFEMCIELQGEVVANFVEFYRDFWARGDGSKATEDLCKENSGHYPENIGSAPNIIYRSWMNAKSVPTVFLPSPPHKNPRFRPTCFLSPPLPPPTPLNIFLLTIFEHARHTIYIQTPNLTSPPVLGALHDCLMRGVSVTIVTSTRMMVLEQLLTAGTVTELCLRSLIRRHKKLTQEYAANQDAEEARPRPGSLSIRYYKPADQGELVGMGTEPVKSHLKACFADGHITVVGSGNMDRASWYTSQELGVAFFSSELAKALQARLERSLIGRLMHNTES
ncbi:MAG: hypothetical protein Q9217_002505 [Psora testacea]